ncbi:hypothetical protein ALP50_02182 [Pseudomonas syringae pv. spinaceae]|nr:hypothetical protein ALP50_02182 [Pseudomonas syringae pv. spinaceae]
MMNQHLIGFSLSYRFFQCLHHRLGMQALMHVMANDLT